MKRRIALLLFVILVWSSFKVYRIRTESQQADKWMQTHPNTMAIWEQQAEWHFAVLEPQSSALAWKLDFDGFHELPYCEDIGNKGSCVYRDYRNAPKDLK